MPKISVIMPACNAEKYIGEAIESILNQTFKDFEFIIINDGSTDSTKKIIENYKDPRIKLINHDSNKGIYTSRNEGLRIVKGEFIVDFDSDDISLKTRLEEQLDFMVKNSEIALVGSWIELIDIDKNKSYIMKYTCDPTVIRWEQIFKNQISNSASFFRRDLLEEVGYFNEKYRYAADFDFWSRIIRKYRVANIPKVLIKQKIHKESITGSAETGKIQREFAKEIIFNNINYYINLNKKDFKLLSDAVKWAKISSFKNFIKVRKIYKHLFSSYIRKENLDKKDIKKILPDYKRKRNFMFKWYIKCKFPKIYNLCKKLFK